MPQYKIGLVLEGGGMRGAYTTGVLDAFMDENIQFPYVIGVSAGANNGANLVSQQRERGKKVFVDYVKDKRYLGLRNLLKERSYFGMEFLFNQLPNLLVPFDYDTFRQSPVAFTVCATNCDTGAPTYFRHTEYDPLFFVQKVLRASSSLPFLAPPVEIMGQSYLDGGMSDSIPINKSILDGNQYNVVVLTRNKGYRKEPTKFSFLLGVYRLRYPRLVKTIKNRPRHYNDSLDQIEQLENKGLAYVIRPQKELSVDRLERDVNKINTLYEQGYNETRQQMASFKSWLENTPKPR